MNNGKLVRSHNGGEKWCPSCLNASGGIGVGVSPCIRPQSSVLPQHYARHFLFTSACECALRASTVRACRHCRGRSLSTTLLVLGLSNEGRMFESAHRMNSGAMFVLSAGSRLLSQREPQSLPVDTLSFVGPVFHSPSFSSFFSFCRVCFERGKFQTINSEIILEIVLR